SPTLPDAVGLAGDFRSEQRGRTRRLGAAPVGGRAPTVVPLHSILPGGGGVVRILAGSGAARLANGYQRTCRTAGLRVPCSARRRVDQGLGRSTCAGQGGGSGGAVVPFERTAGNGVVGRSFAGTDRRAGNPQCDRRIGESAAG